MAALFGLLSDPYKILYFPYDASTVPSALSLMPAMPGQFDQFSPVSPLMVETVHTATPPLAFSAAAGEECLRLCSDILWRDDATAKLYRAQILHTTDRPAQSCPALRGGGGRGRGVRKDFAACFYYGEIQLLTAASASICKVH